MSLSMRGMRVYIPIHSIYSLIAHPIFIHAYPVNLRVHIYTTLLICMQVCDCVRDVEVPWAENHYYSLALPSSPPSSQSPPSIDTDKKSHHQGQEEEASLPFSSPAPPPLSTGRLGDVIRVSFLGWFGDVGPRCVICVHRENADQEKEGGGGGGEKDEACLLACLFEVICLGRSTDAVLVLALMSDQQKQHRHRGHALPPGGINDLTQVRSMTYSWFEGGRHAAAPYSR
jgi:hypothetical protein